jgi:predicted DNA-binding protein (UPF0251 family)
MTSNAAQAYDAGAAAFFIETLSQEADSVYRFGFAVSLSLDGATEIVFQTYSRIVTDLPQLLNEDSLKLRLILIRHAWEIFKHSNQQFTPASSPLQTLLAGMTVEIRGVLMLVDGIGLTPKEVAQVMNREEVDVRRDLAEGRRKLVPYDFT